MAKFTCGNGDALIKARFMGAFVAFLLDVAVHGRYHRLGCASVVDNYSRISF